MYHFLISRCQTQEDRDEFVAVVSAPPPEDAERESRFLADIVRGVR